MAKYIYKCVVYVSVEKMSFKQDYKNGYRHGMYLALYRTQEIEIFDKSTDQRRLYMIPHTGHRLFFVKFGTKIETIYKALHNGGKHPAFVEVFQDDFAPEVRY